ncbi:MAG TPA: YciI family protein [Candidatus Eisenbacteria bacterium]|nr:YciI family protein [Candidatus Eisenbacteria bacterium]
MKRFMLLMLDGEVSRDWRDEQWLEAYKRMSAWREEVAARGHRPVGEPLRTDAEGFRVRRRGGKLTVTDGPFIDAKELVGGYIIVECNTAAEALEIAKACPAGEWGTVEVRPLRVPPPLP